MNPTALAVSVKNLVRQPYTGSSKTTERDRSVAFDLQLPVADNGTGQGINSAFITFHQVTKGQGVSLLAPADQVKITAQYTLPKWGILNSGGWTPQSEF